MSVLVVPPRAACVIIGGGIVGCSVAYHLARKGWNDIVLLEQGPLFESGGSTSHAPGLVFQTNSSRAMCALAQHSVDLYSQLTLDGKPCFHAVGSIEVALTEQRLNDLKRRCGWGRSWGLDGKVISTEEACKQIPLLDPARILGAYAVAGDGIAKAVQICEAMARSVVEHLKCFERTEVTGFDIRNDRVTSVQTTRGRIETELVILCAGIWGPKFAKLAGVDVPLTPVQHQYVRSTPLRGLEGETREITQPILRHQERGLYFRQHADCYGIGSYQHEPLLVNAENIRRHEDSPIQPSILPFTPEHFGKPWRDACELLPALKRSSPDYKINGMFSFTPDGAPLLGETHVKGLWLSEAVWVTHAGGVGKVMAEWLIDGAPSVDLRECDLNRFELHATSRSYVLQRGAQQYREVYDILHPLQQLEHPRPLRVSPYYARQRELRAVFFEGRGWERPQWFESNQPLVSDEMRGHRQGWTSQNWSPIAAAEHLATRERVALFDMTPLTRCEVVGPGALKLLQRLTTNQMDRPVGSVTYTCMCNERGGIKSDVTVTRLGQNEFQLGCNGLTDLAWLEQNADLDGSVYIKDITPGTCCVGLWGPLARQLIQPLSDTDFNNAAFPYFTAKRAFVGEVPVMAQRVSYVGELGWEIYTTADYGLRLWDLLWHAGAPFQLLAAGRATFESMRIEKGYRLWGADMHTEYDPFQAGLGFTVKLDKGEFVGRDALAKRKAAGVQRKLCCMTLEESDVVAMGKEPLIVCDEVVGYVTSATYAFSLGKSIMYGYLPTTGISAGSVVEVEIFDRRHRATVTTDPLFDPKGVKLKS